MPSALDSDSKESDTVRQQPPEGYSGIGLLAGSLPKGGKEDDHKPQAQDENEDMESKMSDTLKPKKDISSKRRKVNLDRILNADTDSEMDDKESEWEKILNSPVRKGPPKNQKDITAFFLQETALQQEKLQDSILRQRQRGSDWYSKMRKSPEQIKEEKVRLRRKAAKDKVECKRQQVEISRSVSGT